MTGLFTRLATTLLPIKHIAQQRRKSRLEPSERGEENGITHQRRNRLLGIGIQTIVFFIFIFISMGLVFSKGVCCGDDSQNATVAKNLVNGLGYSSTIQENRTEYSIAEFDTRLGVGPTIIIPAALIIGLFGNTYWAPGVTIVVSWSLLLLFIYVLLRRIFKENEGYLRATITFLFFSYTFMAYHFEHWYALLGEIPASLFLILAVLIFIEKDSKASLIISGMAFSLAVNAKLVAFLPFASFILFVILYIIISKRSNMILAIKTIGNCLLYIFMGFIIPFVIFELYKFFSLGFTDYKSYWRNYLLFVFEKGSTANQLSVTNISERIDLLKQRFGIFLPTLILYISCMGVILRKERKLFLLFGILFSMIFAYTIYWIFFSIGWARYYIISLTLINFALALPFLSFHVSRGWLVLHTSVLIMLAIYNIQSINVRYPFQGIQLFKPAESTLSLIKMRDTLSANIDKRPFITQWWAPVADMEYLLDTVNNFTTYWDPNFNPNKPFLLIANSVFLDKTDETLLNYLKNCDIEQIGQYVYGDCNLITSGQSE